MTDLKLDGFMLCAAYEAGFAKAIEMAARVAHQATHRIWSDSNDLRVSLHIAKQIENCIKALKPPQQEQSQELQEEE